MNASLTELVAAISDDSRFVAGWVGEDTAAIARLGLDAPQLERLLMCKAPVPSRFASDVVAIATYIGIDAKDLAGALRETAAYSAFRSRHAQPVGLLAAARDQDAETYAWRAPPRVRRAIQDFWRRIPDGMRSPDVLERIVPLAAPIAIVALPRLRISSASRWLSERGVPLPLTSADRPLRGLLLSWRGVGLLMVDGALDFEERRMTVAHELGHFLLDYIAARARALQMTPELLALVDGHRPLTADERVAATLEGVPLGVQTHMLVRDAAGGARASVEAAEQTASVFALELLAPERDVLHRLREEAIDAMPFDQALDIGANVVGAEFGLPRAEAEARVRGALAAIGRRKGFFDR